MDDDLLGWKEIAKIMGVAPATLRKWKAAGHLHDFPTATAKVSGREAFSRAAVIDWWKATGKVVGRPWP